jgi:hypothetical protein
MKLLKLAYYNWEEEHTYLFIAPHLPDLDQVRFRAICDGLLDGAVVQLLQQPHNTIDWPEIVETVAQDLENQGFVRIKPTAQVRYTGRLLIRDDRDSYYSDSSKLSNNLVVDILKHNKKLFDADIPED